MGQIDLQHIFQDKLKVFCNVKDMAHGAGGNISKGVLDVNISLTNTQGSTMAFRDILILIKPSANVAAFTDGSESVRLLESVEELPEGGNFEVSCQITCSVAGTAGQLACVVVALENYEQGTFAPFKCIPVLPVRAS